MVECKASKPTLVLLGRSPEPEDEPEWLTALETEAEIKQAILAGGEASSPKEAGELYHRIRTEREILAKAAAWFARETDSVPPKSTDS